MLKAKNAILYTTLFWSFCNWIFNERLSMKFPNNLQKHSKSVLQLICTVFLLNVKGPEVNAFVVDSSFSSSKSWECWDTIADVVICLRQDCQVYMGTVVWLVASFMELG